MHVDAEAGDGRGPEHGLVLGRREGAAELVHPANKPTYTSIPFLYFLPDKFLYVTNSWSDIIGLLLDTMCHICQV